MQDESKVISIYSRIMLREYHEKFLMKYNQEQDPRKKREFKHKMELFSRRLEEVEAILGKSKRRRSS
jgi:hypothetical protein